MALPGVAGVIVALPDGLSVASQAPEGVDADMLAAFVPQILDRAEPERGGIADGRIEKPDFHRWQRTVDDFPREHGIFCRIWPRG